jgi:hypothetical protein
MPHFTERERLGNRERPVPEARLGSAQLDGDEVAGESPQGQRGLERRNTAAGDQNVGRAVAVRLVSSFRCESCAGPAAAASWILRKAAPCFPGS